MKNLKYFKEGRLKPTGDKYHKEPTAKSLELHELLVEYDRLIDKISTITKNVKLKDIDLKFAGNRKLVKKLVKAMQDLEEVGLLIKK